MLTNQELIPKIVEDRWVKRKSDTTIASELAIPIERLQEISECPEYLCEVTSQVLSNRQKVKSFTTTYKHSIYTQIEKLSERVNIEYEHAKDILRQFYGGSYNKRDVVEVVAETVFGSKHTFEQLSKTKAVVDSIEGSDTHITRQAVAILEELNSKEVTG